MTDPIVAVEQNPGPEPTNLPSRKWLATQVTAISAWLVAFVEAGEFNTTLAIAAIGIGSQALIAYLIPNAEGK